MGSDSGASSTYVSKVEPIERVRQLSESPEQIKESNQDEPKVMIVAEEEEEKSPILPESPQLSPTKPIENLSDDISLDPKFSLLV